MQNMTELYKYNHNNLNLVWIRTIECYLVSAYIEIYTVIDTRDTKLRYQLLTIVLAYIYIYIYI